jgi:hypothetical protein
MFASPVRVTTGVGAFALLVSVSLSACGTTELPEAASSDISASVRIADLQSAVDTWIASESLEDARLSKLI